MISLTIESDRQVHFISAPVFDPEDKTGVNNKWNYNRAPEGYLFELIKVEISAHETYFDGIFNMFDGHEYTHWNIWSGVESRELLTRCDTNAYQLNFASDLCDWECKEYTLAIRSSNVAKAFKICAIVWYRLKKASRLELMEYAIKHPRNQDMFKRALRGPTLEPTEAGT